MQRMREQVCAYDVTRWAKEFLEALGECHGDAPR
jgi:hypothetical protein